MQTIHCLIAQFLTQILSFLETYTAVVCWHVENTWSWRVQLLFWKIISSMYLCSNNVKWTCILWLVLENTQITGLPVTYILTTWCEDLLDFHVRNILQIFWSHSFCIYQVIPTKTFIRITCKCVTPSLARPTGY